MASDLTDDELREVERCVYCGGIGKNPNFSSCKTCQGAGRAPLNRAALAELIRKHEEAAWDEGYIAGYAAHSAEHNPYERDNPHEKGGEQ